MLLMTRFNLKQQMALKVLQKNSSWLMENGSLAW